MIELKNEEIPEEGLELFKGCVKNCLVKKCTDPTHYISKLIKLKLTTYLCAGLPGKSSSHEISHPSRVYVGAAPEEFKDDEEDCRTGSFHLTVTILTINRP